MSNNNIKERSVINEPTQEGYKQRLEMTVQNALDFAMVNRARDINIQCIDKGSIVLSGFADVLGDKIEAENIVNSISEVQNIENNITIPMEKAFSERELEEQVRNLMQSSIHAGHLTDITPTVESGVVTLQGSVDDKWYKMHAQELASNAFNVNSVVNKIRIK